MQRTGTFHPLTGAWLLIIESPDGPLQIQQLLMEHNSIVRITTAKWEFIWVPDRLHATALNALVDLGYVPLRTEGRIMSLLSQQQFNYDRRGPEFERLRLRAAAPAVRKVGPRERGLLERLELDRGLTERLASLGFTAENARM
ncbi:MAG TPA: hypothetical protein VMR98_03720, partial [Candidatus Polarisedimenticolaceae bacterium]|nr:hypothetical protein [Candidatus Polarisedimenticolaceae bacterium]